MIQKLALAPQKNHLAYLKGLPENLSLYVMPVDGSAPPQLLRDTMRCSQPFMGAVWACDGQYVYFAADDGNWFHDLWQADITSGEVTQLTDHFHTNTYPLAAHPNGNTLLLISNLRGELNVRLLDIESGKMRKITDYATPVKTAVYSPHGAEIAYTANATTNPHNSDIYIMNQDGFNKRKMLSTLAGTFDIVRAWCPNGRYLAIDSNFEGGWRAGVLDLRTTSLKWFTPAWETARCMSFSPDGSHLLVNTEDGVQVYEIHTYLNQPLAADDYVIRDAIWLDNDRLIVVNDIDQLHIYNLQDNTMSQLPT